MTCHHDITLNTVLKVGTWVTAGTFVAEAEWTVCGKWGAGGGVLSKIRYIEYLISSIIMVDETQ